MIFVTPRIIRNYIGDIPISEKSVEKSGAAPELKPVEDTQATGETPAAPAPENSHDDSWNQ